MINFSVINEKDCFEQSYFVDLSEGIKKVLEKMDDYEESFDEFGQSMEIKLKLEENKYKVILSLEKFDLRHLNIEIKHDRIEPNKGYDINLENLKLLIKTKLKEIWNKTERPKIIWSEDIQVLQLSQILYYKINKVENRLRNFINISMTKLFGFNWWNELVPNEIKQKYLDRQKDFVGIAPEFKDVISHLLSIDVDDLIEILQIEIVEWKNKHDDEIEKAIKDNKSERVLALLKKQMIVKSNIWQDKYSQYFSPNFRSEWKIFNKNRNHVAHNKLLTFNTFKKLESIIDNVEQMISVAEDKFKADIIPDEIKELLEEERIQQEEISKKHIKETESGIRILNRKMIENELEEWTYTFISDLKQEFYFRNDIEIITEEFDFMEEEKVVFNIGSKINENKFSIKVEKFEIDENEGAESEMELLIQINESDFKNITVKYQNGAAEWDANQCSYMPVREDGIEIENYKEIEIEIIDKINELFPNLLDEISAEEYMSIKDGGYGVVGEFSCDECCEETVSINEKFLKLGKCANCGYEHEIDYCDYCGHYYKTDEGGMIENMCGSCWDNLSYKMNKE